MKKKMLILIVMGIVYFVPALVMKIYFNSSESTAFWLAFGWPIAIAAGVYLEK